MLISTNILDLVLGLIENDVIQLMMKSVENCLIGAVKLTKHVDVDQYKYSGYGIGFDRKVFY